MSGDIRLKKSTNKKIILSGGALGSILRKLGPLLKIATPLATKVLPILGASAAMSGIDSAIQKKYIALKQRFW